MHSSARSIKHSSFVIERRFDYDPAQLYRAWADPAVKARWFNGPADKWKEDVREMDVRVGGRDRLIGKFVDGSESRFEAQYLDVVPEKRLVYAYDMYWQGKKISVSLASVEFVLAGKGTQAGADRTARVSRRLRRRRQPRTRHARFDGQSRRGAHGRRYTRGPQGSDS